MPEYKKNLTCNQALYSHNLYRSNKNMELLVRSEPIKNKQIVEFRIHSWQTVN